MYNWFSNNPTLKWGILLAFIVLFMFKKTKVLKNTLVKMNYRTCCVKSTYTNFSSNSSDAEYLISLFINYPNLANYVYFILHFHISASVNAINLKKSASNFRDEHWAGEHITPWNYSTFLMFSLLGCRIIQGKDL